MSRSSYPWTQSSRSRAEGSSLRMSPRLVDKLTLATEEGTKLTSGVYSSWRSTKTSINMIARGNIRMPFHLRVERPSVSRRESACMSPTSRDVKTWTDKTK